MASALKSVAQIAGDPALPQVFRLINELHAIEAERGVVKKAPGRGIGLRDIVQPLEFYVWTKKNKWFMPVALLAAMSIPFGIGYYLGRK